MIAPWNIWWHNQQPEGARNGDNLASAADHPRGGYRLRRSRICRMPRRGDGQRARGGCTAGPSYTSYPRGDGGPPSIDIISHRCSHTLLWSTVVSGRAHERIGHV